MAAWSSSTDSGTSPRTNKSNRCVLRVDRAWDRSTCRYARGACERVDNRATRPVGELWLNRPLVLKGLSTPLQGQIISAVAGLDADPEIGVLLPAGHGRAW